MSSRMKTSGSEYRLLATISSRLLVSALKLCVSLSVLHQESGIEEEDQSGGAGSAKTIGEMQAQQGDEVQPLKGHTLSLLHAVMTAELTETDGQGAGAGDVEAW